MTAKRNDPFGVCARGGLDWTRMSIYSSHIGALKSTNHRSDVVRFFITFEEEKKKVFAFARYHNNKSQRRNCDRERQKRARIRDFFIGR